MKPLIRTLTPLEKRMRRKYTQLKKYGLKNFGANLVVNGADACQSFSVINGIDRATASWYCDMLAVALARLVTIEQEKT